VLAFELAVIAAFFFFFTTGELSKDAFSMGDHDPPSPAPAKQPPPPPLRSFLGGVYSVRPPLLSLLLLLLLLLLVLCGDDDDDDDGMPSCSWADDDAPTCDRILFGNRPPEPPLPPSGGEVGDDPSPFALRRRSWR
jgi:hypothetical protein